MARVLSEFEKRELFADGKYSLPPTPVPHALWTIDDWIQYIDHFGKWHAEAFR